MGSVTSLEPLTVCLSIVFIALWDRDRILLVLVQYMRGFCLSYSLTAKSFTHLPHGASSLSSLMIGAIHRQTSEAFKRTRYP